MKTIARIKRPVEGGRIRRPNTSFYVYVLFDWLGVPRYVGKGKGDRWLQHDQGGDPNNWLKNIFIKRTLMRRKDIPKIKIAENLSETVAFHIEAALIKAIGRYPNGPLTNLTDTRSGPSSKRIADWHASRTAEERRATIIKGIATLGPDALSRRNRNNALSQGAEALAIRMTAWQASRTAEQRMLAAQSGGTASAAAKTPEERKAFAAAMTPEQRRKNGKLGMAARRAKGELTPARLSKYGTKGIAKANANRTPEERRALARKAGLASAAARTPEQRRELARRGALAGGAATKAKWAATPKPPQKHCSTEDCKNVLRPRNSSGLCRSCAASLRNIRRYQKT